jgi:hypothetical protein
MTSHPITAAVFCLAASVLTLQAQAGTVKPTGKAATAKPAAKAAAKPVAKPAAKAVAKAPAAAVAAQAPAAAEAAASGLNDAQMTMASQVLTGRVDCEFQQTVMVEPHAVNAGHFRVKYNSTTYNMVPEETTTGAVRLVDNKAGVVWLQIPVKSMMMNSKAGRRMVDACAHPTQRMAVAEAQARAAQAALAANSTTAPAVSQSVDNQDPASGTASANAGNPPLLR